MPAVNFSPFVNHFCLISDSLLQQSRVQAPGQAPLVQPRPERYVSPHRSGSFFLYAALTMWASVLPGFQEHQPRVLPFPKTSSSPSRPLLIPSFLPIQAHPFTKVQPRSVLIAWHSWIKRSKEKHIIWEGSIKKTSSGLSNNINNRQNNKWGNLGCFPHGSAVYLGSWSAPLIWPGFPLFFFRFFFFQ